MSTWHEDLLTVVMDCGYADLTLLDDVQYDMYEIFDECLATFGNYNVNNVVRIVFDHGLRDLEEAIRMRICEIERLYHPTKEEEDELAALRELQPFEDIESFHNFLDTSIWIARNEEAYRRYLEDDLSAFGNETGFYIE